MKKLKEVSLSEKITKATIEADKVIKKLNTKINKMKDELKSICTHSEYIIREENHEGGYDYVAQYHKITDCKFCKKELKRVTTTGGYA